MPIDLQWAINSQFALRFISLLGRAVPPGIAYPICDHIGNWIAAQRHSKLTQTYRVNQWVIRGENISGEILDKAVQETLQNSARDIYDLYRYIENPQAVRRMISFSPQAQSLVERSEFAERGLMVLGLHLSNFDLILQSIAGQGLKAMVLTLPDPQGARRVEYERRKSAGMNLVPTSVTSLRQAIKHLEQGGMVVTGIDRPVPNPKHCPRFFGHASSLPVEYVYPPLKARVPVVLMAAIRQADGKYHVTSSEFIDLEEGTDPRDSLLFNAEKILKQAEDLIRLAPEQWNVPLPVWPDLLERAPIK